jgi:hypothetical protein
MLISAVSNLLRNLYAFLHALCLENDPLSSSTNDVFTKRLKVLSPSVPHPNCGMSAFGSENKAVLASELLGVFQLFVDSDVP